MMRAFVVAVLGVTAVACGGERAAQVGDTDARTTPEADAARETLASTSNDSGAREEIEVAAPETVAAETAAAETVDDTLAADDTAEADAGPSPLATCPVPSMSELYPGPIPPFPYGDWPPADECLRQVHDVAIVLGCPSKSDGSPSDCQKGRAVIADELYEAGWVQEFIVSGGAIHNEWNEADSLAAQLAARGIPADHVFEDRVAAHTDENMYYSTLIMQAHGWTTAFVISEDPGHLMMTALCDTNCCVELGRMTLVAFPILGEQTVKVGHYVLSPPGPGTTPDECSHISGIAMCINLATRKACKDNFQLE